MRYQNETALDAPTSQSGETNKSTTDYSANSPAEQRYGATQAEWFHLDLILGLGRDLLPVVSNPNAEISPQSKMKALGKTPSRYNGARQVIGFTKWTDYEAVGADIERWSQERDYGICVQTRHVRALDIDVDDPAEAAAILQTFERALGMTLPLRTRANSGKCLAAFIVEGPLSKRILKTCGGAVELLADGQQMVVAGQHKSGARYEWRGGLPAEFPTVSATALDAAWDAVVDAFAIEPPIVSRAGVRRSGEDLPIDDPVADFLRRRGLVVDESPGKVFLECPWEAEHTAGTGDVSSTAWLLSGSRTYARGHFVCRHAHCAHRTDSDFKQAIGFDETGFAPVPSSTRPSSAKRQTSFNAASLFATQFDPIEYIVPELITPGFTLLVGAPKLGKSWLALDLADAVASGGTVLSGRQCATGDVLYAALEDNPRRLASRLECIHRPAFTQPSPRLTFWTEMPGIDDGGLDRLRQWLEGAADPKLIIIDVLNMVRPGPKHGESIHAYDYRSVSPLKQLADEFGVAVVAIHHTRKTAAEDALESVSGSNGLTGAADATVILARKNGAVVLCGRGRDITEFEIAVQFQKDLCRWSVLGDAQEVCLSAQGREILQALSQGCGTVQEITCLTGGKPDNTRRALARMASKGEVVRLDRGRYALPSDVAVPSVPNLSQVSEALSG